METIEQRWIELQFFFICEDILKFRNDIMDVMDIIDNLSGIGNYTPDYIKQIAQEVLTSRRYRPTQEEFILICRRQGMDIHQIKVKAKASIRKIYKTFNEDKVNPRYFFPRLNESQIKIIAQFVEFFYKFKGVGIL